MTGSFLFVKPSDNNGVPKTIYSGNTPRYQYDHASWEWLLERTLRRKFILGAINMPDSQSKLGGHEDQYAMHRWGAYGRIYDPSHIPAAYGGAPGKKMDASLNPDERSMDGLPIYGPLAKAVVTYGVADLMEAVSNLLNNDSLFLSSTYVEWLPPDWTPSKATAWDIYTTSEETTQGSCEDGSTEPNWTWTTSISHNPYSIPADTPFKCLSHIRTDDPTTNVTIEDDEGKPVKIETARTPYAAPRDENGSVITYDGVKVRRAQSGAALYGGWAQSEFCIKHIRGLDFSQSTDTIAYRRGNKSYETEDTIGCLLNVPDKDSGYIMVKGNRNTSQAYFAPDVDWENGSPSWWHLKEFPKGLDSVQSPKLRDQLTRLCPVCQPMIPPAIPSLFTGFPTSKEVHWDYAYGDLLDFPTPEWILHLALAATPFDMSKRLDAFTTTVCKVPHVFARFDETSDTTTTTQTSTVATDGTSSQTSSGQEIKTVSEGTTFHPIPISIESRKSVQEHAESVSTIHDTRTVRPSEGSPSTTDYYEAKTETYEHSYEMSCDFIVCLRATENTNTNAKTVTTTRVLGGSDSETTSGDLPDSYDPDQKDVLFPDWMLPWIDSAELFAMVDTQLMDRSPAGSDQVTVYHKTPDGNETYAFSGNGSGMRTSKARQKIVSLGQMDVSTGRFPGLDVTSLLNNVDPDPHANTSAPVSIDISSDETVIITDPDADADEIQRQDTDVQKEVRRYDRSRTVSYYAVVKWKFDRLDPESFNSGPGSSLASLYRALANATRALNDKRRELSGGQTALALAQQDLEAARTRLQQAQRQQADPTGAEASMLAEAETRLNAAQDALTAARDTKISADQTYNSCQRTLHTAERDLDAARIAYHESGSAGDLAIFEAAQARYHAAMTRCSEAEHALVEAEIALVTAEEEMDDAQEYYDTLHDQVEELLQKAVDDAQAAVDEASSRVSKYTAATSNAEAEIAALERAVEEAKRAIIAAGGHVS